MIWGPHQSSCSGILYKLLILFFVDDSERFLSLGA